MMALRGQDLMTAMPSGPISPPLCHTLAVLCPLLMAHLAQRPNNRMLRMGLYPVGVTAAVLAVLHLGTRKAEQKDVSGKSATDDSFFAIYANYILVSNFALVGRYAFSGRVYRAHPLPRQPPVGASIRSTEWYRTLDILLSHDRKINYPPNPPLRSNSASSPPDRARQRAVWRAVKWTILYSLLVDALTLPLPLLSHLGLYRPDGSRDFARFCVILAERNGTPVDLVWASFMACYTGTVFCGIQAGWEIVRGLAIGSGFWIEEEWPEIMDKPFLSTSMIELWGKRYHQLLRCLFDTLLGPLNLPKPLYVLGAFTISGIYHVLAMRTVSGQTDMHYLWLFLACGCVCLVERAMYRLTGHKVRGVVGWVWTWTWIYLFGWRSLEAEVNSGQMEGFRAPVEVGEYSAYPLDHVVEYLGLREYL